MGLPHSPTRTSQASAKPPPSPKIEQQGWSLNPGRYVGVAKGDDLSDEDFKEKLASLNEELESLNAEARDLEARIAENVAELLTA